MYKILIVEDHPVFRRAITQLLRKALGKVAVSEAGDAPEAASELLLEFKRAVANLRILALGSFAEEQYAVCVFRSVGNGYLRKNADLGEVIRASRGSSTAADGRIPPTQRQFVLVPVLRPDRASNSYSDDGTCCYRSHATHRT